MVSKSVSAYLLASFLGNYKYFDADVKASESFEARLVYMSPYDNRP